MPFCSNCGANVEGKFCPRCGTPASAETQDAPRYDTAGTSPADGSRPVAAGVNDNVASALCYVLGLITGIVFLAMAPYNRNRKIRFHAFQAIFFHAALIGFWIVEAVLSTVMPWSLDLGLSIVGLLVMLGMFVIWILLLVKTFQGEKIKLPIIGDLAEKQA